MRKIVLLLILCVIFSGISFAGDDAVSSFEKGNKAYREGNWAKAAGFYREAADAGMNNAALWYNLGCAAWKSGSAGRAVLYFERAVKMNPRDPDLKNNLDFVLVRLATRPEPKEGLGSFILSKMTLNELMVLTLVLVWGFFILLFLYLRLKNEPLAWAAGVFLMFTLIFGITSGTIIYSDLKAPRAVILPTTVEVYSGPGRDYTGGGTLTEGSIARVLRTQEDWSEISFKDRFKGWVRKEEIEKI